MTKKEFEEFRHKSVHSLIAMNEQCAIDFSVSAWPRWDYDFDQATLTFSEEGIPRVIANIQIVGTTSDEQKNWEWGWANKTLPSNVVARMREVQAFGEAEGLALLTEPFHPNSEYLGWELTAIAAQVVGAKGAYRCPGNDGFVYLVYLDIRMATADDFGAAS